MYRTSRRRECAAAVAASPRRFDNDGLPRVWIEFDQQHDDRIESGSTSQSHANSAHGSPHARSQQRIRVRSLCNRFSRGSFRRLQLSCGTSRLPRTRHRLQNRLVLRDSLGRPQTSQHACVKAIPTGARPSAPLESCSAPTAIATTFDTRLAAPSSPPSTIGLRAPRTVVFPVLGSPRMFTGTSTEMREVSRWHREL
jgi:hypothetical protein